ncbi:MAG: M28 family peptidase [Clostridia bacterium]|nr:M28 family peptidase [Clostridia bacterium]
MKKLLIIIAALCLIALPLTQASASVCIAEQQESYAISATEIDELTKKICLDIADRTTFTDACLDAANVIAGVSSSAFPEQGGAETVALSTASEYLEKEHLDISVEEYSISVTVSQGLQSVNKDLTSYYVIAKTKNFDQSKKTILFTTNFANHYSANDAFNGVKAEGALGSAATTALTIKLANYLSTVVDAPYNYVFAFFSGTDEGNFASADYVQNHLKRDVMLVINLERLGCGDTYFYTDEAKADHDEFVFAKAANYNLKQYSMSGKALLQIATVSDLPYSHYAILGDVASFLSVEKPCLQVMGGDFSKSIGSEGGEVDIVNTKNDTYENLVKYHPTYASKISVVSGFLTNLALDTQLKDVCSSAANSYKIFTKTWIAYVICIGLVMIMIVALILTTNKLEKKYPPPPPRKIKIAVFGKEFEDINSDDVIVDLKRNKNNDVNPFDV